MFVGEKTTPMLGFIIALVVGIFLYHIGLFVSCYGMGFLITSVSLLIIIKSFSCNGFKSMVLFGIIFFLIATTIGAFCVSKPMLETRDYCSDSLSFNVHEEHGKEPSMSISYNLGNTTIKNLHVRLEKVSWVCYNQYSTSAINNCQHELNASQNSWSVSGVKISTDSVYSYTFFTLDEMNERKSIKSGFYSLDNFNITVLALKTNAYYVGISVAMFLFILFSTRELKKSLEKIRARMESEGRLYPKGHGLCKQCGSVVLPGEILCKKCGTHIAISNKSQTKRTEFFQCSECNAKIPINMNTCPKCGVKFDEEDETTLLGNPRNT